MEKIVEKKPYEELLELAELLSHDEWVGLDKIKVVLGNIYKDEFYLEYLNSNQLKRLRKIIKDSGCEKKIKIDKKQGIKGFCGLKDLCINWRRRYLIPESIIEFVSGSVNYELLNLIQYEVQEKGKKDIAPFISIGDDDKNERDYILKFAEAIIEKRALLIEYEPFFLEGKTDILEFSPEFIRRVGDKKWMVYGISKSNHFKDEKYVNLIFNRIKGIKDGKDLVYKASGVDYANQPFSNQITFHAIQPDQNKPLDEVIIKVIKKKEGYQKDIPFFPFRRIQKEVLHHSQEVVREDQDYGYIRLRVSDATKLKPILLGWGADLEVIQPASLREVMEKEVQKMNDCYNSKANTDIK